MLIGSKKNVFLVVCVPGQAVEILEIAKTLQASNEFNPIIYFNLGNTNQTSLMSEILSMGLDILDYNLGYISSSKPALKTSTASFAQVELEVKANSNGLKNRIKTEHPILFSCIKWLAGTYYGLVSLFLRRFSFIHFVLRKIERMKKEGRLFKEYAVKLLVLAEDSEGYFTPQLVRVAQKNRAKVVVFPYTFANQFEFLEDAYLNNRVMDKNFATLCAGKFFPKWARFYKDKKLLRWNPDVIFAAELFGSSPANPWVMNSGFADVIAVESQFMQKYYAIAGIPAKQMLETGFISLDKLGNALKNKSQVRTELSQKFRLDPAKPWLVCAVPPSQWPHPGVGFSSYDQFLKEFIIFLKGFSDIEVIFKFHPRVTKNETQKLCEEFGIANVAEYATTQLIGVADFYLASVSATIRWALACGLPTINYDLYAYRYDDFAQASGLYSVELFSEFKILFKTVHDEVVGAFARKETKITQPDFGQLDGKSAERILSLFRHLTESS